MLLLPLIATVLTTQAFHARFDSIPNLSVGQRVRIHFMVPAPPLPIRLPGPLLSEARFTGTLVEYRPFESISLQRNGWIGGIGPSLERTVAWVEITRIETPQPRNALNVLSGAAGGYVSAIVLTAIAMYSIRPFCDAPPGPGSDCPGFWSTTRRIAVYSVPIGAVVGFFSTRWKPVYRRH